MRCYKVSGRMKEEQTSCKMVKNCLCWKISLLFLESISLKLSHKWHRNRRSIYGSVDLWPTHEIFYHTMVCSGSLWTLLDTIFVLRSAQDCLAQRPPELRNRPYFAFVAVGASTAATLRYMPPGAYATPRTLKQRSCLPTRRYGDLHDEEQMIFFTPSVSIYCDIIYSWPTDHNR